MTPELAQDDGEVAHADRGDQVEGAVAQPGHDPEADTALDLDPSSRKSRSRSP